MEWLILFLAVLVGSATPLPIFAMELAIFTAGATMNWPLVGLVAGVASTIGEMSTYLIGRGGGKVFQEKKGARFAKVEAWFRRRGFWAVIVFAFTPLPMDLIGFIAGVAEYPVKRFLAATFIGKLPRCLLISWAGFVGWEAVKGVLS